MFGRPLLVAAAILVAGLSLTACHPQTRAGCPAGERCLEYGNGADPTTLDPQLSQAVNESVILRELFFGLYVDASDGSPTPGLVQSQEISADGLTWTFKLKPAKWSDGVPVTANDFVFTYRRMLDPKTGSAYAYLLYVLKNGQAANQGKPGALDSIGAKALDDETLQLTLAHPAAYLPQLLKHTAFYPLPAHVVQRWDTKWVQPEHFVGDGPYVLKASRLGDYVRIEKNPYFAGKDQLCFDRVNFYPTTDVVGAERQVVAGQLDINTNIQSDRVKRLQGNPRSAPFVRAHKALYTSYIAFNLRDVPALKDIRVRQAISMAIDRDFIADKILGAGVRPAYAFVPPGIADYVPLGERPHPTWSTWPLTQRQDEARRLMAAAGFGPDRRLKLELKTVITQGSPVTGQSVQADLKSVYVDVNFRQEDGVVVFDSYNLRAFQLGFAGWVADYNDPMTFLALMKSDTGFQNYGDYQNPKYDALLNAADNERDGDRRAKDLAGAEQMMLDDVNIAPIITQVNLNLVNHNIDGWVDNDPDIHPIRYLCPKPGWTPGHN